MYQNILLIYCLENENCSGKFGQIKVKKINLYVSIYFYLIVSYGSESLDSVQSALHFISLSKFCVYNQTYDITLVPRIAVHIT